MVGLNQSLPAPAKRLHSADGGYASGGGMVVCASLSMSEEKAAEAAAAAAGLWCMYCSVGRAQSSVVFLTVSPM